MTGLGRETKLYTFDTTSERSHATFPYFLNFSLWLLYLGVRSVERDVHHRSQILTYAAYDAHLVLYPHSFYDLSRYRDSRRGCSRLQSSRALPTSSR